MYINMAKVEDLKIKIFADGADKEGILEMNDNPFVKGFTTNPSFMRKAGITDYESFAKDILSHIKDKPISFEVFSDDFDEMHRQAMKIADWADNVYVKVPIMNTKEESSAELIKKLAVAGVKLNITALMTAEQVKIARDAAVDASSAFISVFAGRVADVGCDPMPIMTESVELLKPHPNLELLWASTREVINIFQADSIGCEIITVGNAVINKLGGVGKDLNVLSLDTVKKFYDDSVAAGFEL